ncbi:hypothetical protein ACLOJK_012943, partial [Asimina triloba]
PGTSYQGDGVRVREGGKQSLPLDFRFSILHTSATAVRWVSTVRVGILAISGYT